MSLKDNWKNKVDDVDDVLAEDINMIAEQAIENEKFIKGKAETNENKVSEITDEPTNEKEYPTTEAVKKYLNEKIKQPDYNQNDTTQPDYIKNRPFYSDGETVHKMDEKFIPDTIARTADIDKKIQEAAEDVDDKIAELKIKNKASGTLLALPDSAEQPLQSMKIFGKTTQFTTTGKNKLPYPYYNHSITKNGITFTDNGDGSITLNGTATSNANFFLATSGNFLEAGKTYCIVTKMPNVTTTMIYRDENGQTQSIGDNKETSVVWSENYTLGNISIYVAKGTTANNTVYPIIVEGTSYDGIWEPYTGGIPSPNPNYPQELVSVGDSGSTTEYVMGKNLFGGTALRDAISSQITTIVDDEGGTIQFASSNAPSIKIMEGKFKEKTAYTLILSGKNSNANTVVTNIIVVYTDGMYEIPKFANANTKSTCIFVTNANKTVSHIGGQYASASTILYYNECGVFEGSLTLDDFETYKEQSLTIPTPNGLPGLKIPSYVNSINYDYSYAINGTRSVCDEKDYKHFVYRNPIRTIVFTGDENWQKSSTTITNRYSIQLSIVSGYGISSHFQSITHSQYQNGEEGMHTTNSAALFINASQFATLEEFKAFLKSQYEAGTPFTFVYVVRDEKDIIETPLTEEEIQAYKALHTNYPNTTIYNSDGAGAEVEYVADTKNYIDNKINKAVEELSAAIITE